MIWALLINAKYELTVCAGRFCPPIRLSCTPITRQLIRLLRILAEFSLAQSEHSGTLFMSDLIRQAVPTIPPNQALLRRHQFPPTGAAPLF